MIGNDAATVAGTPGRIEAGGKTYRLHPLTIEDVGELQAWVDAQPPNPFDVADAQVERRRAAGRPFTVQQEQFLLRAAMEEAVRNRRLIGSDEATALLRTPDGLVETTYLSIVKGDPTFTRGQARDLVRSISSSASARIEDASGVGLAVAFAGGADPGPKAGPGATPPGTTPPGTTTPSTG